MGMRWKGGASAVVANPKRLFESSPSSSPPISFQHEGNDAGFVSRVLLFALLTASLQRMKRTILHGSSPVQGPVRAGKGVGVAFVPSHLARLSPI
jgi:hypothetical protein